MDVNAIVDPAKLDQVNVLPDSRLSTVHTPRQAVWRGNMYWVPIYCPSCGAEGGEVPQESMTFAFWLCDPCFKKYGELTNLQYVPDEVFFEKVKAESLERYGRVLSLEELDQIVAADASPLATLIKQGR
jgi:transposase-like protein